MNRLGGLKRRQHYKVYVGTCSHTCAICFAFIKNSPTGTFCRTPRSMLQEGMVEQQIACVTNSTRGNGYTMTRLQANQGAARKYTWLVSNNQIANTGVAKSVSMTQQSVTKYRGFSTGRTADCLCHQQYKRQWVYNDMIAG
jgi:hypothetical protein